MSDVPQTTAPEYMEDLSCREVYVETAQTLFGAPGMLRVELCVNRWRQQAPIQIDRVVPVARFALSYDLARALRDQLTTCLEVAEKQGSPFGNLPGAGSANN
jgi:hypothetical protein